MTSHPPVLPSNWPEFWSCVRKALLYAHQSRNPRKHLPRFTRELKRLLAPYREYRHPHIVADLIDQIWNARSELRAERHLR